MELGMGITYLLVGDEMLSTSYNSSILDTFNGFGDGDTSWVTLVEILYAAQVNLLR
jgi:hypothetical protein